MISGELKIEIGRMTTKDELREVQKLLNARWSQLDQAAAAEFYVGQTVTFEARGEMWTGVVRRINQRTLSVDATVPRVGKWKVAASLCKGVGK